MGLLNDLFHPFHETVFLKTSSDLENKVNELTKLKEQGIKNDELEKELLFAKLGLQGEREIEYELKNANIGMYVLHDITLQYEDSTAQIDYIIITPCKIYFIECKNLIGNITVNERGEFIREYIFDQKNIKEGIYSPLRQAERHIDIFHKIWSEKNKGIRNYFRQKNFNYWYVPLAVTSNAKNIVNTRYAPKDIKNKVIKSELLVKYLIQDINKTDKDYLLSKKNMYDIALGLLSLNVDLQINYTENYLKNHESLSHYKENHFSSLKEKLLDFRRERSSSMKVPAYYVFNNEELDRILQLMPKSVEELKNANILPVVKINSHGKEIVDIINHYDLNIP